MPVLRMSTAFAQCANDLPPQEKIKLARIFMLLTDNPGHPVLQLQKLEHARRRNVYECRLDKDWKIILERTGEMTFDLIYVGTSDDALHFGESFREHGGGYGTGTGMLHNVRAYLAGCDEAIEFTSANHETVHGIAYPGPAEGE